MVSSVDETISVVLWLTCHAFSTGKNVGCTIAEKKVTLPADWL